MPSVISQTPLPDASAVTRPLLVLGYETSWAAGNIVHNIIGTTLPAVTLRAAGYRTGTLSLLYSDEALAQAAVQLHRKAARFSLTDTDRPSINMTYVASGSISLRLDPETLTIWVLEIDYTEVSAP
jgi:hypothetical protein